MIHEEEDEEHAEEATVVEQPAPKEPEPEVVPEPVAATPEPEPEVVEEALVTAESAPVEIEPPAPVDDPAEGVRSFRYNAFCTF